jgi:5-methylthioadenosine/S-adenosylhomocysteine deaminase
VASSRPSIAPLGDIEQGDLLIEDGVIAQIGCNLSATDAEVVDARSKIVLPGLIDTHRHTWETLTRSWISEGDLAVYQRIITGLLGPKFRPQDVHIGNLLGCLGALNSGITTLLDWSHVMNSPAHADAAIKGLADSGIRGVFAYGYSSIPNFYAEPGAEERRASDLKRVQKQFFQNENQLLSLAVAARGSLEGSIADIKIARSLGLRTTLHMTTPGRVAALDKAGMLGSDLTFVHTVGTESTEEDYRLMAACGGTISTSSATEMMSGHGYPSAQRWLAHGLRPSFSVDNETRIPSDLFAQMRALVISDHMLETERARKAGGRPVLIPVRDVLEFATVEGARATALDRKVGTLTIGKRADVIVIDLDDIDLIPAADPIATVVLRVQAANVSDVFVDGQARKRNGKLVGVDLARVRALVEQSNAYLLSLAKDAGVDMRRG